MVKIKKFTGFSIKTIPGGKDPLRLVEEFIIRRGFDPKSCLKEHNADSYRWMMALGNSEELEILVESLRTPAETTIYMGVNVATVPLKSAQDFLVSALQIADGLVGIKVSLVGYFLVLSASLGLADSTIEDLDYSYKLIVAQKSWFQEALLDEMDWEDFPEE